MMRKPTHELGRHVEIVGGERGVEAKDGSVNI